jgi:type IV pilus assembly protein PilE
VAATKIKTTGFSLLELVIVLAVIGVLLTLAIPSYQRYTQRVHRAEAIRMMLAVADCQERVRASAGFYDTSSCGEGFNSDTHDLRIEPPDNTMSLEYTIVAQLHQGSDDACGDLSLNQAGTRGISGKQATVNKCWGGR